MSKYKIVYTRGDSSLARVFSVSAESEGEAMESFEYFQESCDDYLEVVSITEVQS